MPNYSSLVGARQLPAERACGLCDGLDATTRPGLASVQSPQPKQFGVDVDEYLAPGRNPPHGGGEPRPAARSIRGMTDSVFKPGDDVFTTNARGIVIDVRATPSGKWVFGVEDARGEVNYFTAAALRPARR